MQPIRLPGHTHKARALQPGVGTILSMALTYKLLVSGRKQNLMGARQIRSWPKAAIYNGKRCLAAFGSKGGFWILWILRLSVRQDAD